MLVLDLKPTAGVVSSFGGLDCGVNQPCLIASSPSAWSVQVLKANLAPYFISFCVLNRFIADHGRYDVFYI